VPLGGNLIHAGPRAARRRPRRSDERVFFPDAA